MHFVNQRTTLREQVAVPHLYSELAAGVDCRGNSLVQHEFPLLQARRLYPRMERAERQVTVLRPSLLPEPYILPQGAPVVPQCFPPLHRQRRGEHSFMDVQPPEQFPPLLEEEPMGPTSVSLHRR